MNERSARTLRIRAAETGPSAGTEAGSDGEPEREREPDPDPGEEEPEQEEEAEEKHHPSTVPPQPAPA
jgi:hypothetical protein